MANDRNYDFPNDYDRDDGYGARDFGSGRDYTYSSAREYRAAGDLGGRDDRNFRGGGTGYSPYGDRGGYRPDNWGGRETYGNASQDYYGGASNFSRDYNRGSQRFSGSADYRGAYASDGHRWTETGDRSRDFGRDYDRNRDLNRDRYGARQNFSSQNFGGRDYGRTPQGYDYQDRGFLARAGDEVRSWFGDEDAERRREYDQRYDERMGGTGAASAYGRDHDYSNWRRGQIDALDRDYHEYRQENAKKFENEFGTWRNTRQTQRQSLGSVREHMDVVGSDGAHVGTVDKVRGDRIILTKGDSDAGGRHHSIPSSWIQTVDDKVTIAKSADDAQKHWRDEETSGALFGDDNRSTGRTDDGKTNLNRSFSGTY